MICKHCDQDMRLVNMEMSNSAIANPRFHHFHQCFSCGWADKRWVSIKVNPELAARAVPWNEDIYDDWLKGQRF